MPDPQNILSQVYGLESREIKKLNGYENENFLVITSTDRFVLKTYQSSPSLLDQINAENQALIFLADHFPTETPRPVQNKKGGYITSFEGKAIRMLTFQSGQMLGDIPHSPALFKSLGTFLGKLDVALKGFSHPVIAARQFHWDLQYFLHNEHLSVHIKKPAQKKLVDHFFRQFKEKALPHLPNLRKQTIHGDANEWNLLVEEDKISGIIDFGDICFSPLIHELAIGLTYALLGKENPLDWAVLIIEAYHQEMPLLAEETDLLYYLIAARLCTSVCNSTYDQSLDPTNSYISSSQKLAWSLLEQWIEIKPSDAQKRFRTVIRVPLVPPESDKELIEKRNQS